MDWPKRLVILGDPVSHSLSPVFQNAALTSAGIALTYERLQVSPAELPGRLQELRLENAAGNVTIPHKEHVFRACMRRSELAERVGAVNTFWHEEGQLVGDNTDVAGAEIVMRALLGATSRACVAIIGAGGAAAAVVAAAELCGVAEVRVYNRNAERALRIAGRFPAIAKAVENLDQAVQGADLVVNATPVGLSDASLPVAIERLSPQCAVFDLVYRADGTAWSNAARAAGHKAQDGKAMLVEQGAVAFERWFGRKPDRSAMHRALA